MLILLVVNFIMEISVINRLHPLLNIVSPFLIISTLLAVILTGCAGRYRFVPENKRIHLTEGEVVRGTFEEGRQVVEYDYILRGKSLQLRGFAYAGGNVNTLEVRLLFVGKDGHKIDEKRLYYSGYRIYSTYAIPAFQKTFNVPAGTDSITYDFYVEYRTSRN